MAAIGREYTQYTILSIVGESEIGKREGNSENAIEAKMHSKARLLI